MAENPEIGRNISTCGYSTNYHDLGQGESVLLLHGSGAGVSGWVNWRGLIPELADKFRVVVPDLVGFGFTDTPTDFEFRFMDSWIDQILALLDALGIERAHVVGNSFGGALALWLASRRKERFGRLVLMGPGGWPCKVSDELAALWGYTPSPDNMRRAMSAMAHNQALITEELVELRTRATLRRGAQQIFERVFPKPHQRWLDAQVLPIALLQAVENEVLLIHGREDRVVPSEVSWRLHHNIPNSQLHMFGNCGHWTMIEHAARFQGLVRAFLDEPR